MVEIGFYIGQCTQYQFFIFMNAWTLYKERDLIENHFLKLKNHHRFSPWYEKKALYFQAVVCLACICLVALMALKHAVKNISPLVKGMIIPFDKSANVK